MYVELHAHSSYSFCDGASLPAELATRAAEYGYEAFALTDHDNVCGAMELAQACKGLGVRPIHGAELTDRRASGTSRCWSSREAGWHNLCRLLTEAHAGTRPKPGREPLPPALALDSLLERNEGLVCLSGCARDGAARRRLGARRAAGGRGAGAQAAAARSAASASGSSSSGRCGGATGLATGGWRGSPSGSGCACVATGNVHAHDRARAELQDALVAVRTHTTLEESEPLRRGNASSVLAPPAAMAARFAEHPEAVAETARLAERLRFDLTSQLGYRYPGSEDPDADRTLAEICRGRLELRYAGMPERPEAERRLEEELRVIRKLGLSGFFLLHFDLLELAREIAAEVRGPDSARNLLPPGRGRGSSVSSVVCYLTGLSHVDPVRAGLFLGRFLNDEIIRDARHRPRLPPRHPRAADPPHPRPLRARALGAGLGLRRPTARAAPCATWARCSACRRGRSSGWPGWPTCTRAATEIERDIAEVLGRARAATPRWRWLARLAREAWGLPRHLSQHPGGMVLSTRPLVDICPVQPAAMEGRQIVQWDKDSCADAGFLKIDLLGLGMLSAVERCVESIAEARDERIDLSRIPLDDEPTFEAIRAAETTGVFQIESRAQMQMLPRSLPETLDDVIVQVALVRPGPIQGGAVHPYLERRRLLREDPSYEIPYEHPSLEPILADTLGAIVFQDQVIQVAMAMAGFSAGEAEGLRRAMSRRRSEAALNAYGERFVAGAVERGVDRGLAERVFEQVRGFSGFGFPKSHAAAFGLLAYQSTWLRVHYGPELLCALFNEQPMGFYPPDSLTHEAQRRGSRCGRWTSIAAASSARWSRAPVVSPRCGSGSAT